MKATAGEVVEQHGALGDHVGVVVRDAGDAGAELDVSGALRGGGDEDLWAGDDLAAGGVVLADPRLVVAELVEVHDQVEVTLQCQRRIFSGWVKWGHEDPEAKSISHR